MTGTDQQPDPHDEARDRLTDRVLAEALGDEHPPDLSNSILDSLEEQKVDAANAANPFQESSPRRWRARLVAYAAVAALLIIGNALLLNGVQTTPGTARRGPAESDRIVVVNPPVVEDASGMRYQIIDKSLEPDAVDDLAVASVELEAIDAFRSAPQVAASGQAPNGLVTRDGALEPSIAQAPVAGGVYGVEAKVESAARPAFAAGGRGRSRGADAGRPAESVDFIASDFAELQSRGATPMGRTAPATPASPANAAAQPAANAAPSDFFAVDDLAATNEEIARFPRAERWGEIRRLRAKYSEDGATFRFQQQPDRSARRPSSGRGEEIRQIHPRFKQEGEESRSSVLRALNPPIRFPAQDRYATIQENPFTKPTGQKALSTFSIDVDTASYTNTRQYLLDNRQLPPPGAVRVEELINYFDYAYQPPAADGETPFAASLDVGPCPWKPEHRLVRIGVKGREIDAQKRPLSNLVFLVDVSGSMNEPNKLPLVVEGLKALTDRLGENDRVAIVVYAGNEGLVLPSTSGERRDEIRSALGRLTAGGSTAGGAGIRLAYDIAERNQIVGGVNRVVLCTDGDFNVGLTGTEQLAELVETRAKETGVFLTVLGFGRGNLNDEMLEAISGRGNGHYAYIDSEREARRVLSRDLAGTLVTIAKDVKLQVEFNPANVASYRLIGYENRVMAAKDFADDTKDAGEIGAGHTVTALYEVVPVGVESDANVGLKYQAADSETDGEQRYAERRVGVEAHSDELLTLKIRYKQPDGDVSTPLEFPLVASLDAIRQETIDFRFATAVAEFGMLLRGSEHVGDGSYDQVLELAREALGDDPHGYRAEFLDLVRRARDLKNRYRTDSESR